MNKAQRIAASVTLLGLGVVGFGLYRIAVVYVDFGTASAELPAAVRAYRADGLPFTAADLAPPHLDPAHDATSAIRTSIGLIPPKAVDARVVVALRNPGPDADTLLVPYAKPLALLTAACDRPAVDFAHDWDRGPDVRMPETEPMKRLTRAATLRAVRSAQRGDDVAALHDLDLARRLATWVGQEPTLISMFVRIANETTALQGAELCLAAAAKRPERIARYARWLKAAPPLPRFGDALRGEAYLGVAVFRNFDLFGGLEVASRLAEDKAPPTIDPTRLRRNGVPEDGKLRAVLARHLQAWDEAFRTTDGFRLPPEAIGHRLDAIAAEMDAKKGLSYLLEGILFPVFGQAGRSITGLQAKRVVAVGFAEALTTHALTGHWPTRVPGIDPFTGGPLHVKRSKKEFRVYSVGRDGKDDGGLLRREAPKRAGATYDEAAVYPPVPR